MKRLFILFAIVPAFFIACDEEGVNIVNFELSRDSLFVAPEGATEFLQVISSEEWTVSANQPWISVSPANGMGSTKCTVLIDSTLSNGALPLLMLMIVGANPGLEKTVNPSTALNVSRS